MGVEGVGGGLGVGGWGGGDNIAPACSGLRRTSLPTSHGARTLLRSGPGARRRCCGWACCRCHRRRNFLRLVEPISAAQPCHRPPLPCPPLQFYMILKLQQQVWPELPHVHIWDYAR